MGKCSKYIQIPANILLTIAIAFFILAAFGKRIEGEAYIGDFGTRTFNQGWIMTSENGSQELELPTVLSDVKGKTISIENVLPADVDDGMRLFMRTSLSGVQFYIDDELRGSYGGSTLGRAGDYPPSSYVMLDLKEEDAGKVVRIQVTFKKRGKLSEIQIGYGNNAWFTILKDNLPMTIAAFILTITGAMAMVTHLLMKRRIESGNAVLFLGQAMIIVGLWILSESQLRQLFLNSPSYSSVFAYMLIELIGGYVAMYFNEVQKYQYNRAYVTMEILVFGQVAFNTVAAFTGMIPFYRTLTLSHVWIIVGVFVAVITIVIDIKTERIKQYAVTAGGMLIFLVFGIAEFVGYYVRNFHIWGINLCIGLIVLLLATIIQTVLEEVNKIKHTTEMEKFQSELEKKVEEQTVELRGQKEKMNELFIQTVLALSEAVDAKDRYTSGHSKRVAEYARMIAARMGKNKSEQEEIYRAGLLHDVGKIRVPVDIINKAGKLTDEEFNTIKLHPITGYHILRGISGDSDIAIAAKYHHERYDGRGYPNGIAGEIIPEVARILGVADSYDAMTSNRSYRKALPQEVVREEIVKGRGTQFDPEIADIMLQMMDEDKDYRMKQNDFGNRKILIVDDEPMNHKMIAHILKEEPIYEFSSANGGATALKMLEEQEYDLIMLDVMMPEMDGLTVLKLIREKYKTPVILMTGDKNLEASTEFADLGCDDYITKPFQPLLVKEVVYNITKK